MPFSISSYLSHNYIFSTNTQVAKEFGKKFATGSSVTKVPSGGEEIVVQGDVSDEIEEFLLEKYKDIPEDNIELVDDKKSKKAAAAAAAGSSAG